MNTNFPLKAEDHKDYISEVIWGENDEAAYVHIDPISKIFHFSLTTFRKINRKLLFL